MADALFWAVVPALGLGTFLIRFSFLGAIGSRPLPAWLQRGLRYTAVAILPGLVAPAVLWPPATDGQIDLPRLAAACVTLLVGLVTRNVLGAILAGGATLYALLWF